MKELHLPIKQMLRTTPSRQSVARMWARIDARERIRPSETPRLWALGGVAAAFVALALVLFLKAPSSRSPHEAAMAHGPLLLAGGQSFGALEATSKEKAVLLRDGSKLTLSQGASLSTRANTSSRIELTQGLGRVRYSVTPGGPRAWSIDCDLATVEVVGTSFQIEREVARVRVAVESGVVSVRGATVPGGEVRLTAGMSTVVERSAAPMESLGARQPPAGIGSLERAPPVAPSQSTRPAWKSLAAKGDNKQAYAELGSSGIASAAKSATVEELFALSDVARLSGHPSDAVLPLENIVSRYPSDGRASLAALTLGRVYLHSLGNPRGASSALERALALGVPSSLSEDAQALLVEAYARAGDRSAAKRVYDHYVAQFPASPRRDTLKKWIGEP